MVFDVVAFPPETPLIGSRARARTTVITGAEVIALQAAEQFELYTGVRPTRTRSGGRRSSPGPEPS